MPRPVWSIIWTQLRLRKPGPKGIFLVATSLMLLLGFATFVVFRTQHTLEQAGAAVEKQGRFPFELRNVSPTANSGFEPIATPPAYTGGAFYQGKLYVSGPGGLSAYGGGDLLLKQYRTGFELPAVPLGAMAVGRLRGTSQPELLIATRGEGVLIYSANAGSDGSGSFRQLRPTSADARDVTALMPLPSGELLIGTRRLGLLVYHGGDAADALTVFHPQLANLEVTALTADATGFWLGTRNQGVRHWHGGEIDSFTGTTGSGTSGLPDPQIEAIAVQDNRIYVGTPLGVEEFVDGHPSRLLARNIFAQSLLADDRSLTIGSLQDGIQRVSFEVNQRPGSFAPGRVREAMLSDTKEQLAVQFLRSPDQHGTVYAVTRNAILHREPEGNWEAVTAHQETKPAVLADGNVSALAFDPDGRLWVGYFDRGLDILSADGEHAEHHEEEPLFCVNRLTWDERRRRMAVATADGLVLFGASSSRPGTRSAQQVLTRKDGLIADHVTDVAFSGDTMILATPAGLTYFDSGGARSLYAFEGLVNNHVYALGVGANRDVLAGTLGGVSVLENESVVRNLTARNSGLKQNWVTALVPASANEWLVGTYGAGVMLLGADGRFTAMEGATRSMVVNPNAMLATPNHILAGTLGQGLWSWSRATGRWSPITAGLPSENVTALATRNGEIYVGTENGLVRIAERLLP